MSITVKLTGQQLIDQCVNRAAYWRAGFDYFCKTLEIETQGRALVGGDEAKVPVIERLLGVAEPSEVDMSRERAIYAAKRLTYFLTLIDTIANEESYTLHPDDLQELEWRFDAAMDPLRQRLRHL